MRPQGNDDADSVIDSQTGEEVHPEDEARSAEQLQGKLKKLRDELRAAQSESKENLDGWQRARAELVNARRAMDDERVRMVGRVRAEVCERLLPVLDHMSAAQSAPEWREVDESWRSGVERIFSELESVLQQSGCEAFGTVGDAFDPVRHEAVSVESVDSADKDDTVLHVLQSGYMVGETIVRPAKVVVAKFDT